jgi:hypothetical protein
MVCHFTGVQSKGTLFKGLCCQLCGGITFNMGVLLIPHAYVPEPSIIALFGLGLVGIGFARSRRS